MTTIFMDINESTHYRVLKREDILKYQEDNIKLLCSVLLVSRTVAVTLLQYYAWNLQIAQDAWFNDEDRVLKFVGLTNKPAVDVEVRKSGELLVCGICFEFYIYDNRFESFAEFCGHSFCSVCLEIYVSRAIRDGPGCLLLRCPDPACHAVIGEDMVDFLVSDKDKKKYKEFLFRSYVENNKKIKWCPAPDCEYAIEYKLGSESYDVACDCSLSFCWNCVEESHLPVSCETVKKWMSKNSSGLDDMTWIIANSKQCPKCNVAIQKNQGLFCIELSPGCFRILITPLSVLMEVWEDIPMKEDDNESMNDDDFMDINESTHYRVLKREDILKYQEDNIKLLCSVLSVSRTVAVTLLQYYAWNLQIAQDAWFNDEDRVLKFVGLTNKPAVDVEVRKSGELLVCGICFEFYVYDNRFESFAEFCGHSFCSVCLEIYVSRAIHDGPGCLLLRCPDPACHAVIGEDMVDFLVSDEDKKKYKEFLFRSYVENNKKIKWCPAPGCEYAIEYKLGSESYDVACDCSLSFCWNCVEESHLPFCWICLGPWGQHDTTTCNRYRDTVEQRKREEKSVKKKAERYSTKYAHYYERWDANRHSRERALADLHELRTEKLQQLEEKLCQTTERLKFITEAWEQVAECRRVLKWTYVYGYYMPQKETLKKELFEYLQGEAEVALERLHDCAENTLKQYFEPHGNTYEFDTKFRTKLVDLTRVTRNYFENFVKGVANGLSEVKKSNSKG
ncbi:hypothetical protein POM88_019515 [Heracleum sosnowskyi]|uniref:RBR-type E3 ubiquitin transferase n=1 Tax=Heracleum sosnowskyi TaxID=360622 RepID=A0AAD8MMC2_9APIA|nr:hypothetical protein POM88_019515 [Heracleum sosnowskyi]